MSDVSHTLRERVARAIYDALDAGSGYVGEYGQGDFGAVEDGHARLDGRFDLRVVADAAIAAVLDALSEPSYSTYECLDESKGRQVVSQFGNCDDMERQAGRRASDRKLAEALLAALRTDDPSAFLGSLEGRRRVPVDGHFNLAAVAKQFLKNNDAICSDHDYVQHT